jgi:hypothetical protein
LIVSLFDGLTGPRNFSVQQNEVESTPIDYSLFSHLLREYTKYDVEMKRSDCRNQRLDSVYHTERDFNDYCWNRCFNYGSNMGSCRLTCLWRPLYPSNYTVTLSITPGVNGLGSTDLDYGAPNNGSYVWSVNRATLPENICYLSVWWHNDTYYGGNTPAVDRDDSEAFVIVAANSMPSVTESRTPTATSSPIVSSSTSAVSTDTLPQNGKLGAIIGGVVGGVIVLIAICCLLLFKYRRPHGKKEVETAAPLEDGSVEEIKREQIGDAPGGRLRHGTDLEMAGAPLSETQFDNNGIVA